MPLRVVFHGIVLVDRADCVFGLQWSVVDSPILFNCKSNHVHGDDVEGVMEDEDIDISQVSQYLSSKGEGGMVGVDPANISLTNCT